MYSVQIDKTTHEVAIAGGALTVDGKEIHWDLVELSNGHFHILYNHKSYRVELVSEMANPKGFTFKINDNTVSVGLKDKFDLLLEKLGMSTGTLGKVNNVKAPMPGLIIELRVHDGDTVKSGDTLLILEAMKMENVIKAPMDGMIKTVRVKKGDSVEKNQVLIEF